MSTATHPLALHRWAGGRARPCHDVVAVEAPLEVRVDGVPFAVIMRTPGDDAHLALGFLFAERVVREPDDVAEVVGHGDEAVRNRINVRLTPDAAERAEQRLAARRQVLATSACGLCGRLTLDTFAPDAGVLGAAWTVPASLVGGLPDRLREVQPAFDATGGLHAAGLFDREGTLVDGAEDVGRHNAVDKIVGRRLLEGALPSSDVLLAVSGRASFEIVQKAWLAGIPILAAVSAPSSLAVETAIAAGMTLAAFVRGGGLNVYSRADRLT